MGSMPLSLTVSGCGRGTVADGDVPGVYTETVEGVSFKMVRVQGGHFHDGLHGGAGEGLPGLGETLAQGDVVGLQHRGDGGYAGFVGSGDG